MKLSLGVALWLNAMGCYALEKFEVLPDLPDNIILPVSASTVSGNAGNSILGAQTVGHEPSIISVVLSLIFVVLLIYLTGIIYAKLNKVGFNTLKKHQGELAKSQVSVLSTTQLGNNKTLHVVELDGKRMLIGASTGAIQLIKDLGNISTEVQEEEEYSHIEIPDIKIPKIEIPKIEIPSISFSKIMTKAHKKFNVDAKEEESQIKEKFTETEMPNNMTGTNESSDGIIDSLFTQEELKDHLSKEVEENTAKKHVVDPDEFTLYKKYLG